MNPNFIEEQQLKINVKREETRSRLRRSFDEQEEGGFANRINTLIAQLDVFEKGGLVFDKLSIVNGLKESLEIHDREKCLAYLLKVLEPLIILQVTHQNIFEKVARGITMDRPGNRKLSEVLYCFESSLNDDSEEILIHLTTAKDFMTRDKIGDFKNEIVKGLTELAKIIKNYPNIKEILAVSWIVPMSRKRLEELGFTFAGVLSEEEKKDGFASEGRPVGRAFIKREDFLARYGK